MEDSKSLSVVDFLIGVLRQHEKDLDKSLATLKKMLEQMEKTTLDTEDGETVHPTHSPVFLIRKTRIEKHGAPNLNQFHVGKIRAGERLGPIITKLLRDGKSIEEIALRLDTNPSDIERILQSSSSPTS